MTISAGPATPKTDAKLKKRYFNLGLKDKIKGMGMIRDPQDLTSLVGGWYLEGFNSIDLQEKRDA